MLDLRAFTVTLCQAMGATPPAFASKEPYLQVGAGQTKKAMIYCPDAYGAHALHHRPDLHDRLVRTSTDEVSLLSVAPPVTPVCFASLFTGATPAQHGIEKYEKPVLRCETVFDSLVVSGKKVAIVAVRDSSVDVIFRDRDVDYFSVDYDPLVTAKALELLHADRHDVIVVYHQEYDDLLHATAPFSALAQKALEHHVDTWELLASEAKKIWKKDYLLAFTPDHGAHVDEISGHGDHGRGCDEDMQLRHFFVRA